MSNVILFVVDEHNPFYSSVYGHPFIKTPNMDKLAKMGTTFKNTYCPSPLCMPSRSALMTGKRIHEIQAYSNCNINLDTSFPSYGEILSQQGIYTAFFGKVDAYKKGEEMNFSELHMPNDRKLPGDTNICREPLAVRKEGHKRANGFGIDENASKRDNQVIDEAIKWLETKPKEINQPWVLIINVSYTHFPLKATKKYWDMYEDKEDLPLYGSECKSANHLYARELRKHFEADLFTQEQIKGLRHGYYACVSKLDDQIGRILDTIDKNGYFKDTNFIYTSDHGEMLGKFGMWWKCSLYEDSVRIPCIACGSDFSKDKVVKTPTDLFDVQASIFDSVNAKRPETWHGQPLPKIPEDDSNRVIFSEYHGHGTSHGAYMIRKGDWKLIYYINAENQLFDLSKDPEELNNVYSDFKDKATELENELYNICSPELEDKKALLFQREQIKVLKEKYGEE